MVQGDSVLHAYNVGSFGIGVDAALLLALTFAFGLLGYIGLNISTRPKLRLV